MINSSDFMVIFMILCSGSHGIFWFHRQTKTGRSKLTAQNKGSHQLHMTMCMVYLRSVHTCVRVPHTTTCCHCVEEVHTREFHTWGPSCTCVWRAPDHQMLTSDNDNQRWLPQNGLKMATKGFFHYYSNSRFSKKFKFSNVWFPPQCMGTCVFGRIM